MRKILVVAKREYLESVRTKAFLIGILLVPLLMGGGVLAQWLLKDQVDTKDRKVVVIESNASRDLTQWLQDEATARNERETIDSETGEKIRPAYIVESAPVEDSRDEQRLRLSDEVRENKIAAFLEIESNIADSDAKSNETLRYYSKGSAFDEMKEWLERQINTCLRIKRAEAAGISPEIIDEVTQRVRMSHLSLLERDDEYGGISAAKTQNHAAGVAVPFVLFMLMYMMLLISSQPMLHSALEEKNQGIAETLLGAISTTNLMFGKLLGNVGVTCTTFAAYFLGGAFTARSLDALHLFPFGLIPWFVAYLVTAVFLYGSTAMALGAACNDVKETQNMAFPHMLPLILPMFIMVSVVREPNSTFAMVTSLIPLFTPTVMILRQATPDGIPVWQPWLGLALSIGFTVFCVWLSGRVFRVALLVKGQPLNIPKIIRWAIRG